MELNKWAALCLPLPCSRYCVSNNSSSSSNITLLVMVHNNNFKTRRTTTSLIARSSHNSPLPQSRSLDSPAPSPFTTTSALYRFQLAWSSRASSTGTQAKRRVSKRIHSKKVSRRLFKPLHAQDRAQAKDSQVKIAISSRLL